MRVCVWRGCEIWWRGLCDLVVFNAASGSEGSGESGEEEGEGGEMKHRHRQKKHRGRGQSP